MKNANPVSRGLAVAAIAWASFGLVACAREQTAAAAPAAAPAKTAADFFPIKIGERTVRLQLAVRPHEMQRGLMERRDLGKDDGMIFVYDKPQQMNFWMRNTPTPLDIGFFGPDGALAEVYPLHPFDEKTVSSRGKELRFAVETNQGWYAANGVKPGQKLDLKALAAALKERGFDPKRYGL
ncbi:MAG: hypothetical protein B9S34_07650 [Opitutia bacterium Tous-C1TDCM]|nr:MAG: hypothetical protein B9S34_07650 [Opitutae bacterium Tous-C1TDCM]